MLFEKSSHDVNEYFLKESIENNNNYLINNFNQENIKDLMSSQKSKNDNEDIQSSQSEEKQIINSSNGMNTNNIANNFNLINSQNEEKNVSINQNRNNEYLEKSKKNEENNKNDNNINFDKYERKNKDININIDIKTDNIKEQKTIEKNYNNNDDNSKISKTKKVKKIEKILKKNILDNASFRKQIYEEDKKYNTFYQKNQIGNNNNKRYIFFGLSSNIDNKRQFPYTPNRFNINENNGIINNINIKRRHFSPNINYFTKNNYKDNNDNISTNNDYQNINNNNFKKKGINNYYFNMNKFIKSDREEKDYDNILKNQLKDMENQINLLEKGISDNKNKTINYEHHFDKSENIDIKYGANKNNINFDNKYKGIKNNINTNKYMNTYIKFSSNNNPFFSEEIIKYKYNSPSKDKHEKSLNNSLNDEQMNNDDNKNKYISQYVLKDLASNNTIDLNSRIDNLEKCVYDIKKEINSMSLILSNLTSNNFFKNTFK